MNLLKAIVVSPSDLFRNSREKRKEIVSLFIVSFIVVFVKSFFKGQYTATNFFENQTLNKALSVLSHPQATAITTYFIFFVFSFLLFLIIKLLSSEASFKSLLLSLMSISGIGILAHLVTMPLILFAKSVILPISYAFYLWVVILTLWSIKNSQSVTLIKAIPSFLIVASPFVLFGWLSVISPYLVYLAV